MPRCRAHNPAWGVPVRPSAVNDAVDRQPSRPCALTTPPSTVAREAFEKRPHLAGTALHCRAAKPIIAAKPEIRPAGGEAHKERQAVSEAVCQEKEFGCAHEAPQRAPAAGGRKAESPPSAQPRLRPCVPALAQRQSLRDGDR